MFKRILIANRAVGSIRAAKTYSRLGVEAIGVYTETDKNSLHLKYVDKAYPVGSYLDIKEIVQIAKANRCEAIDPVYGFRAEHPEFPATCEDNGIVFIGPSNKALKMMEDKISTSNLMKEVGIQIIPRSDEIPTNENEAVKIANDLGFPVVIKPVSGGGGKGTLVAWNKKEVRKFFPESERTAKSTTDNPYVYIEKFLRNVRHEESQFVSDNHGNAIYLGGRSCSLQRRKQKIIEERQSKETEKILEPLRGRCINAIKRAGYGSAITFEFLVDRDSKFCFLEANKRLQVEHRPTELTSRVKGSRIDLVEERMKIAEGKKLDYKQSDVSFEGWALNCRLYAEDPWNDFKGCTGSISAYEEPKKENVIIDSCLYSGYSIPFEYDPLVATITAFGNDRDESIERMGDALKGFRIGSTTNLSLLRMILEDEDLKKGGIDTTFVERKIESYKLQRNLEELSKRMFSGAIES